MTFIAELWLPILLSGVFIFIVSTLVHMVLQWHISDHTNLPDEDGMLEMFRDKGLKSGSYVFPHCECGSDYNSEEMQAKIKRGPVGFITVFSPEGFSMGKNLLKWFLFTLLISVFVAYITNICLTGAVEYLQVFRVAGTAAFLAYAIPALQDNIWKGQAMNVTFKFVVDGTLYALTTAGTFAWLWPAS
ncbi:MAG: hypothetical protein QGH51_03155 [Planctomycetota bacterium]|jgi:hypothetical protein|nr:hypothetical protein [Planctomycetota bacterium]